MQRFHRTLICPKCRKATVPFLLRTEEAQETARPRIPKRDVVQCARKFANLKCENVWYVNAED